MIDADRHTMDLLVDGTETRSARRTGSCEPRYTGGFLAKYARLAQAPETSDHEHLTPNVSFPCEIPKSKPRARAQAYA